MLPPFGTQTRPLMGYRPYFPAATRSGGAAFFYGPVRGHNLCAYPVGCLSSAVPVEPPAGGIALGHPSHRPVRSAR